MVRGQALPGAKGEKERTEEHIPQAQAPEYSRVSIDRELRQQRHEAVKWKGGHFEEVRLSKC